MTTFAAQLKSEIQRLARKEIRAETTSLKKSSASYRAEIAALKRRIAALEAGIKKMAKPQAALRPAADEPGALRWRAAGFATLRKKLALSAADMGKLLGVSGAAVLAWEAGKSKPRASHLPTIARVRKLGKRAAAEALAGMR